MHATMSCAAAYPCSSSSDAGRHPLTAPTFTIPTTRSGRSLHIPADDIQAARDTRVAASPVPHKRKRARFTQEDLTLADQAAFLKHVRTLDRLEALGILEGKRPRPLQEDMVLDWPSWSRLQYGRYLNRLDAMAILGGTVPYPVQEDLAILERRRACSAHKNYGDVSIVLAESEASSRNKRADLDTLNRRESRKARLFGGPIHQRGSGSNAR